MTVRCATPQRIVQAVSVICRNNRTNENIAREIGLVDLLASLLEDVSEELVCGSVSSW